MFADDIAFVAHYHHQAQEIITRFAKTEMMYHSPPGVQDDGKNINMEGTYLNKEKHFK